MSSFAGSGMSAPITGLVAVMIGGLLFSQVLTLYTTPVIYLAFDRLYQFILSAGGTPPESKDLASHVGDPGGSREFAG